VTQELNVGPRAKHNVTAHLQSSDKNSQRAALKRLTMIFRKNEGNGIQLYTIIKL